MKKIMLFVIAVAFLIIIPLPAKAMPINDEIAVSRINSANSVEFIEIYNYSSQPIDVMRLTVKSFNSNGNQNFSKDFDKVTLLSNGFTLIAQNGTVDNSDASYTANNITPLGGKIEIYLDLALESEICWGTITCGNHVTIADSAVFMTESCALDENCSGATIRFGGVTSAKMCQFDNKIFASSENCINPSNGGQGENPTLSSRELAISEIAARVCLPDQPNCTNDQAKQGAFIEIYNNSTKDFTLSGWRVQYASATAANNYQPGNYSTVATVTASILGFEYLILPGAVGSADNGYIRIIDENDQIIDLVGWGRATAAKGGGAADKITFGNSIQRCELPNGYLINSGTNANDFVTYLQPTKGEGVACLPPKPVNHCTGLILSEIAANVDEQFIEIANPTNKKIDITSCQLMTNRNQNKYVLDEGSLPSKGYLAIYIKNTNLTLTKTTTGTVYLQSSDGTQVDVATYSNLRKETSWALVKGVWRQTYELTPNEANIWEAYPACPDGQYRNLETGRCRKVTAVVGLVPCKEGYERNPLTNRCRKIPIEAELKPCAEGWERNPETNRCRKIVSTEPAAFAIQPGGPIGNDGIYLLVGGGILITTAGIVSFQFRMEITRMARRLMPKFSPTK
ncbi:MAG: lamin tail domain-containing protein [Candidatus Nomurabacteria bacterium]|nr:lamin tail domain-containing protein [Candidatus Nomurabacteria bacterium]